MNANSFITFFKDMLRNNAIRFLKELYAAFKLAPAIKNIHIVYMLDALHMLVYSTNPYIKGFNSKTIFYFS